MSRGLSSTITDELAKGQFVLAHLVKLELTTVFKYTDAPVQIVDGSDTYIPNGFLFGVDGVTEQSNINIGSMRIGLSAVNQSVLSVALSNGHLDRKVTIKRCFLDSNMGLISGAIFSVYVGKIEGMSLRDRKDSSEIEFKVANQWSDFQRTNGRRTNTNSQQQHFTGDLSLEFAPQAGESLIWGKEIIDVGSAS